VTERPAAPPVTPAPPLPPEPDELRTPWRRLDARMLLIHPVQEAIRFLPALLGIFILGRSQRAGESQWWELASLALVIGIGVLRYLTTRFRIENGQIELRKGLVNKMVIATPQDRVRTVDLTAPPFHRILGLAKVEVGTAGHSHERLVLDALPLAEARTLREELIHRRIVVVAAEAASDVLPEVDGGPRVDGAVPGGIPAAAAPVAAPVAAQESVLLRLDPAWVRYAPLTMSGLVSGLALFGFSNQFLRAVFEAAYVRDAVGQLGAHAWWTELLVGVVGVTVVVSVLAVIGYVLQYWRFRLTRHPGGTLHVTRGLLTTRETSIEEKRLRGVEVGEPLGLRLVGGGRLRAITTGLSRREDDRGSAWLVPPAPRAVVAAVAGAVMSDHEGLTIGLTQHGSAALRRRWTRALWPSLLLAGAGWLTVWRFDWPWLVGVAATVPLLLAPFLARDRYAGLGHALSPTHLVVRSGSFSRRRDVLQRSGVIGWTIRSSWFQRRAGLTTLVATTAAGKQSYTAYDIPRDEALSMAHEVDPTLLAQFLVPTPTPS